MNEKHELEQYVGRLAYKNGGYFGGVVGRIERSKGFLTPYKLVYKSLGSIGINKLKDITLLDKQ